jgi:hypothetical protein
MSLGNLVVSISELQFLRQSLHESLSLIDKLIGNPQETISSPPPKKPTKPTENLGKCIFVNKKTLQQKSIETREQIETCQERCSSKAVVLKNGIPVCKRHEKSDTSKIETILSGKTPEFTIVEPTLEEPTLELTFLEEGDYFPPRKERSVLEMEMDQCEDLDKLLENTDRVLPCRLGLREICLVVYRKIYYAIDPLGECLGKITEEANRQEIECKMKTKEYYDIEGKLEFLCCEDREFLENFRLTYSKRHIREEP